MSTLKEIFDFERIVNFLQQGATGTIVVFCTINNSKELIVWKGDKWESVFGNDAPPGFVMDSNVSPN